MAEVESPFGDELQQALHAIDGDGDGDADAENDSREASPEQNENIENGPTISLANQSHQNDATVPEMPSSDEQPPADDNADAVNNDATVDEIVPESSPQPVIDYHHNQLVNDVLSDPEDLEIVLPSRALRLGDEAPDFSADTTLGHMDSFHHYIGDSWVLLCSHPADFTPVCTTEVGMIQKMQDEFTKRNVKTVVVSCDSVASHNRWINDITETQGVLKISFPLVGDPDREIATMYGMLDATNRDKEGLPLTVRSVFLIGPDKLIKCKLTYPASCGRNFIEIIRVIDSVQLTADKKVATPANWIQGGDCMISPSVNLEEAAQLFPKGFYLVKPYLRITPQP